MKAKEAIEVFNNPTQHWPHEREQAITLAINAFEKQEKYKWHDLRKNPKDLPENKYGVYLTRDEGFSYPLTADGFWISNPKNGVIAWREIEPFEEDNE